VVAVRRVGRRLRCPSGHTTTARYDTSRRYWRHLDFGTRQVWLQADVHRIDCAGCGRVRTAQVPWARPAARHSHEFEDQVAWLAQRMDKTSVARLMRCSWEAVDRIVTRVVAPLLTDRRLDGLRRIGVDEVSYRRGHRYLTVVADHDTGRVVWVSKGSGKEPFEAFFDALGPQRAAKLEAITMDGSTAYRAVALARAPQAVICLDPFHIIKMITDALDTVFRAEAPVNTTGQYSRRTWRQARYALRAGLERLKDHQREFINGLRRHRRQLHLTWELKEELRDFYRIVKPRDAARYLKRWCTAALRANIPALRNAVTFVRKHFDAIVASVRLGLSNSRLEGINAKIRVIQRQSYGYRNPDSLVAMIFLRMGGITINLPTQR
jgi:transposase